MKYFILLLALLPVLPQCAFAQKSKKVPVYELTEDKTATVDPHAASGLIKGFTQITLVPDYSGLMDTFSIFKVEYYPTGYVKSSERYKYVGRNVNHGRSMFPLANRLTDGSRFAYEYDNRGNITARKYYTVGGQNSQDAMMVMLQRIAKQEEENETLKYIKDGELDNDEQVKIKEHVRNRVQFMLDSLGKADVSEVAFLERDEQYSYDNKDNPVYSYDSVSKNNHRYRYTYHDNGLVNVQRSHYHSTANGNLYYSTTEHHFRWDERGNIGLVSTYIAENDSGEIATEKNLRRTEYTHYNKKNLPDSIMHIRDGRTGMLQLFSYTDTLRKTETRFQNNDDTSTHTTYKYDKGREIESVVTIYRRNKPSEYFRTTTAYDKNGLPVETRGYSLEGESTQYTLKEQSLFFYGLDSDKETAKRRLQSVRTQTPKATVKAPAAQPEKQPQQKAPVNTPATPPGNEIFSYVEAMPEFPGDVTTYLKENLRYPLTAKELGVEGTVYVKFVIDKEGKVSDATVVRRLHADCDKEALRLISTMPKWKPGRQNGRPVSVYYTLPVRFKID